MMDRYKKKFFDIFSQKVSLAKFMVVFLSIIALRVFVEQFVALAPSRLFYEIVIEYIHNLYFFLITFSLLWIGVSLILDKKPSELSGIFTFASVLVILPPVLDIIKTGGAVYWSFYLVSSWEDLIAQFFSVFGHLPSGIVYFGTKIVFIAAIILISGVVFLKSRYWAKALLSVIFSYVILFFMGSFPSVFAYFYYFLAEGKSLMEVRSFHIAQLFGSPGLIWGVKLTDLEYSFPHRLDIVYFPILVFVLAIIFYLTDRDKLWATIKNLRFPQLIYHAGLFFIGIGLGYINYPESFNWNIFSFWTILTLILSIWLAWKASVVVNDIEDLEIDRVSNPGRPLPSGIFNNNDYIHLGIVCFLLSLLGAISVGTRFFALILIYQIIAWFYSAGPLRLKRFPLIATGVSAIASILVLLMGYILMAPDQSLESLSWRIISLLFISYTLSLPIKDFKDIKGDAQCDIWTIPVIFGEKNGRLVTAVGIFASFMISVFFLNEFRLFWWALLSGTTAFLIVTSSKIDPRRLSWWIIVPVFFYLLVLVKVVFIDNSESFLR